MTEMPKELSELLARLIEQVQTDRVRPDRIVQRIVVMRSRHVTPKPTWPSMTPKPAHRRPPRSSRRGARVLAVAAVLCLAAVFLGVHLVGIGARSGSGDRADNNRGNLVDIPTLIPATATATLTATATVTATSTRAATVMPSLGLEMTRAQVIAVVAAQLDTYWRGQFAAAGQGAAYLSPAIVTYAHSATPLPSACGSSNVTTLDGFYCAADHRIYLVTEGVTVVDEIFILGHEWGHHVRALLDPKEAADYLENPVPQELQAVCASGVWASVALATGDLSGVQISSYAAGLLNAGDPIHGSGQQLHDAFVAGFGGGKPVACGFHLAAR